MSIRAELRAALAAALPHFHVTDRAQVPDAVTGPTLVLFIDAFAPASITAGRVNVTYALWVLADSDVSTTLEDTLETRMWDVVVALMGLPGVTWSEATRDKLDRWHGYRIPITIQTQIERP